MSRFGRGRGAWDEDEPRDIRVTDRRRIHLDDEGDSAAPVAEVPNLKPSYVEELEARTRAAEQKVLEVQGRFEQLRQQLQNETDETRRRLNKAADERAHREKANFIEALLPVLDNLQRATEATESGASAQDVAEGVRRTATSFENALIAAGVEPLASVGEQFNPELHDAVETAEVEPEDEGKVIEEYARGYRIGDRLLRPARVKVGRAAAKAKAVD
jgi:molecular chaperone GrpE